MRKIFIFIILIIAALPRGIELLNGNYLWGFDQGEHYNAVKEIVVNHEPTLIGTKVGGAGGFFQGPGWYYLLTIPFLLFSGNPYGGMVLMFLIGLATVFFSFYFGKKMFGEKIAFIIAFLIAISPEIIPQSRFIWPPFPVSLITVFYLYFLFKLMGGEKKYLPLAVFAIGVMAHFEIATAGTLLFQLALFSPVLFWKRLISLKYFLLSIVSFSLALSPLILFDFRNQHIITKGILNMFHSTGAVVMPFDWIVRNHLDVFRINFYSTFYGAEMLWPLFLIFFMIGLFFFLRQKKTLSGQKLFVIYVALSPLLLFIVFLKYGQGMWTWWILELAIMYCFLFGILLMQFWKGRYGKGFVVFVLLLFSFAYIKQTYNWYLNDFGDYGGVHKIKGKTDALDFIYTDAKGKPFNLFVFTPPIYTYAYDYVTWWYGKKKYGYLPGDEKKGTFYLWIEPDPSKPWTYKGWMETVIKEGKVLKTVTLPSGFIIQKRVLP